VIVLRKLIQQRQQVTPLVLVSSRDASLER